MIALHLVFPDYLPRALAAEPIDDRHRKRSLAFIHLNDVEQPMPNHYEDGWIRFNSADIERCIAKIALCEAVRIVDKSIRDPVLSQFILEGKVTVQSFSERSRPTTSPMTCTASFIRSSPNEGATLSR